MKKGIVFLVIAVVIGGYLCYHSYSLSHSGNNSKPIVGTTTGLPDKPSASVGEPKGLPVATQGKDTVEPKASSESPKVIYSPQKIEIDLYFLKGDEVVPAVKSEIAGSSLPVKYQSAIEKLIVWPTELGYSSAIPLGTKLVDILPSRGEILVKLKLPDCRAKNTPDVEMIEKQVRLTLGQLTDRIINTDCAYNIITEKEPR
jgi:hypothetical protein